jgi:hypothetical protein
VDEVQEFGEYARGYVVQRLGRRMVDGNVRKAVAVRCAGQLVGCSPGLHHESTHHGRTSVRWRTPSWAQRTAAMIVVSRSGFAKQVAFIAKKIVNDRAAMHTFLPRLCGHNSFAPMLTMPLSHVH